MSNINNWPVLQKLEQNFASNIKFVCIFGEKGDEVLIVTKDDLVFAFGSNRNGCLGLGYNKSVNEPIKVEKLCHKQMITMAFGWNYVIALTKSGSCFSWGRNDSGQLGNGTTLENNRPTLIHKLITKHINAISCGYKHSLVLTQFGEVYAFGNNDFGQLGIGSDCNQLIPFRINSFYSEKIIAISCSSIHSLALTESGYVFSWGYNENGNLGIGSFDNKNIPQRVRTSVGVIISQIVCGLGHNLMLSTDGDVYSFGLNNCKQIGNKSTVNQNIPHKVYSKSNKFIDIASEFMSNISIALSQNGNCFLWGLCHNEVIDLPTETTFQSIDDIFAFSSERKITYKPISFDNNSKLNELIFEGPKYSQIKFRIHNKYIFIDKSLLKNKCKYFERFCLECHTNEILITEYSYSVYYSYIKYIQTECLDIRPEEAIDLYRLAIYYSDECLTNKCFEIIENYICIENVCTIYSSALKYGLQEIEYYCFNFCSKNLNKICKTIAFLEMDEISIRKFITRVADNLLFK